MQRLWNLDILRIVSIAAVVIIHTASQYLGKLDVTSPYWEIFNFYDGIVRWAVPVFVMISGALFLNPAKEQSLKKLFSKNILRIATIILFWGLVYAALSHPPSDLSPKSLLAFFKTWVLGHYHMWFLYMIAGLYIMVPILRCITASERTTAYFLVVAFIFNSLIPFFTSFGHLSLLADLTDSMLVQMPIGYSFYFVLGYWLVQRTFNKREEAIVYLLGLLGLVVTIGLTAWASHDAGKAVLTYYANFSLPVCLTSVALFVLSKRWQAGSTDRSRRCISLLSTSTLGVYLVHVIVLDGLQRMGLDAMTFDPLFAVPATAGAAIIISFAVAALMTKIPVFGKHCV